ncbi:MAG TPA: hypothetical protein DCS49_03495 [Gammaproteobacteria bacterium]|nr:hypothetical protein [Gammaproteobacteria bacterium]
MLRVILFCDICNTQGIRYIEQQRSSQRGDKDGRRISDGRAWFEGTLEEAESAGWLVQENKHICPGCIDQHTD